MTEFDPEDPRTFEEPFTNDLAPDEATDEDERPHDTLSDQERGEELLEGVTDPEKELKADWSDLPTEQVNLSDDQEPLDEDAVDEQEPIGGQEPLHEPDTVPTDPSKERQREANEAPDGGTGGRFQDS